LAQKYGKNFILTIYRVDIMDGDFFEQQFSPQFNPWAHNYTEMIIECKLKMYLMRSKVTFYQL
jgi:hypothetical protein